MRVNLRKQQQQRQPPRRQQPQRRPLQSKQQPYQQQQPVLGNNNCFPAVSSTTLLNSRTRSNNNNNNRIMFNKPVIQQQQQQHQQTMRGGARVAHHHQQQQTAKPRPYQTNHRFNALSSSPIKINHQRMPNFNRQMSQPPQNNNYSTSYSHFVPRPRHNFFNNNNNQQAPNSNFNDFQPMNSNSFLSFSALAPTNNNNNTTSSNNNQVPRYAHKGPYLRSAAAADKLLSAPYNTTQYIMYDYSKRKTSSGANAQKEQFEHDWAMQMSSQEDGAHMSEQFVKEPFKAVDEQQQQHNESHTNIDQQVMQTDTRLSTSI